MGVWQSNPFCNVYPCTEIFNERVTVKEKEGTQIVKERKTHFDLYLVVTPQHILALRIDSRNRNQAKLHGLATIHAIEKVKQGIDEIDSVKIQCRQFSEN